MNTRSSAFISKSHFASLFRFLVLLVILLAFSSCMMPFLTVMDSVKGSASDDSGSGEGTPVGGDPGGDPGGDSGGDSGSIEPLMVTVYGPEFMLAWDAPAESEVELYRLHYREHGTTDWFDLGESDAAELTFEVNGETLPAGYGYYEFAVQSVDPEGTASDYHTSVSETAQPSTGWYVYWQPAL